MSRYYFWVAIFFTSYCNSYELSSTAGLRTFPFSGAIDAQYKSEYVIWDNREQSASAWKFGFVQPKLSMASHGLAEAGLAIFPIGILELGASLSTTSRFYESKPFDCALVVCKGILSRENSWARVLLGYESNYGALFLVLGLTQTKSSIEDGSKFFVDEVERVLGSPGGDELRAQSVLAGVRQEQGSGPLSVALMYRKSEYQKSLQSTEYAYLIFRKDFDQLRFTTGVGQYHSSSYAGEFSALAAVTYRMGQSLSLF